MSQKPRQRHESVEDKFAIDFVESPATLQDSFSLFAQETARLTGRPITFFVAVLVIILWAVTGPLFGYSDTWQLVINTGTTIVTFLMVFLIQNTQNRDTLAIQLKLTQLILAMKEIPDSLATIEDLSDEELDQLHRDYRLRAETTLAHLNKRRSGQKGVSTTTKDESGNRPL